MWHPVLPGSPQVDEPGLRGTMNSQPWKAARRDGFGFGSKDDGLRRLGPLRGALPKVLVLAVGNRGDAAVLDPPAGRAGLIGTFDADPSEGPLVLRAA